MNFTTVLHSNNKVTLKEAGMQYFRYMGNKQHLLYDPQTRTKEIWVANKDHASFGLVYKNTHLEFASSVPQCTVQAKHKTIEEIFTCPSCSVFF